MNKEKIESIFGKFGIEIKEIKSATNSFNSNVYIITSPDNKRYVLKFCNNEKKMLNESKYMKYLKHYLPVSDVVGTGEYDERYYIIQSFFEGSNKYDEDANQLSDEQVKNIGILLGKLHSCELLEENTNSWITYSSLSVVTTIYLIFPLYFIFLNQLIVSSTIFCSLNAGNNT